MYETFLAGNSLIRYNQRPKADWMIAARLVLGEESPGFKGQGCQITSGGGDSRESATENNRRRELVSFR